MEKTSFETFRNISFYDICNLKKDLPSAFNGSVDFIKYRITIEQIDEPRDVLIARLQTLWDYCDNWHEWKPLKNAAKDLGYELVGSAGSKNKKGASK